MQPLPRPDIQTVADELFSFVEQLIQEAGDLAPLLLGIEYQNGKVAAIDHVGLGKNAQLDKLIESAEVLQRRYPAVACVLSAWQAPDSRFRPSQHPDRQEIVTCQIYSGNVSYSLDCQLQRNPTRLIKGELSVEPVLSRHSTGNSWTPARAKRRAQDLRDILLSPSGDWKEAVRNILVQFLGAGDAASPAHVIFDRTLPQVSGSFANASLERVFSVFSPIDAQMLGVNTKRSGWLAGLRFRCYPTPDGLPLFKDAASAVYRVLRSALRDTPIRLCPNQDLCCAMEYLPVSLAANLVRLGVTWGDPYVSVGSDGLREMYERLALDNERAWNIAVAASSPRGVEFVIPVYMTSDTQSYLDLIDPDKAPSWTKDCDSLVSGLVAATFSSISGGGGPMLEFVGVNHFHHALCHAREYKLRTLVALAMQTAKSKAGVAEIHVELARAHFEKPTPRDVVMATVWTKDGQFLAPVFAQYLPFDLHNDLAQRLAIHFLDEGAAAAHVSDIWREEAVEPRDEFGSTMFLDANGNWFSPAVVIYPEARGILRRLSWKYPTAQDVDATVQVLPLPHRLARAGLPDVVRERYAPEVYRVIKEVHADTTVAGDDVWQRVADRVPGFAALRDKFPHIACPDPVTSACLRILWSKSPTMVVRSTLQERLAATDFDFRMPAKFVRAPYRFAYIHFSSAVHDAGVSYEVDGAVAVLPLEGAFVQERKTDSGRQVCIQPVWRRPGNALGALSSSVTLNIDDENLPLEHYLRAYYDTQNVSPEDAAADEAALGEVVKVLVYMGLRDARVVERPVRTETLRGLSTKSPEKQRKVLHKSRALYDHVLVGPETSNDAAAIVLAGHGANKAPHHRRGHFHTYRVGPGRVDMEIKFVEPVIVNKHLLTDPVSLAPKDYKLH